MRLFVAVDFPDPVRASLAELLAELGAELGAGLRAGMRPGLPPRLRPAAPERMHLTVAFLG
ncbi:MAG TPA: hypothetical protein VIM19_19390, partial [Actinomycetes bacterium]